MRFLHKFLRAVGFSQYTEKKQVQKLIRDIIIHADERSYTTVGKKTLVAEFDRNFAEDIGIAVCGEFDEDDTYSFDYYLPYLRSDLVSTAEDISIERHAAKESYAGIYIWAAWPYAVHTIGPSGPPDGLPIFPAALISGASTTSPFEVRNCVRFGVCRVADRPSSSDTALSVSA